MSEDYSDAEAALATADSWFSRRLDERYNGKVAKTVRDILFLESRAIPLHELAYLRDDFGMNFPNRDDFFSSHLSRFHGYAENSWTAIPEKDTRELETMSPAFEIIKKSRDLACRIWDVQGDNPKGLDAAVESAFTCTFNTIGGFTAFCLGYLRTRMLNSHTRMVWKINGEQHGIKKRNFMRVWNAVSYFNICVFGDVLAPAISSSRTLMPPQYPFQGVCGAEETPLSPLQSYGSCGD